MKHASSTPDVIDPELVPKHTLVSGAQIPVIGLGTFGSDAVSGETVATAVRDAATIGYRHFDCASVYGNEYLIGHALKAVQSAGVKREDLWITSKLWNDKHAPRDVIASCEQSLRDLQLDYLDLYLVHWPFPNFHPPQCEVSTRSPDARPYIHAEYMQTWRAMERLVTRGLVRHIGTLFDGGIHALAELSCLFGTPEKVFATARKWRHGFGEYDEVFMHFTYTSGLCGIISHSAAMPGVRNSFTIRGTSAVMAPTWNALDLIAPNAPIEKMPFTNNDRQCMWEEILAAFDNNSAPPYSSIQATQDVAILETVANAIKQGREEAIPLIR